MRKDNNKQRPSSGILAELEDERMHVLERRCFGLMVELAGVMSEMEVARASAPHGEPMETVGAGHWLAPIWKIASPRDRWVYEFALSRTSGQVKRFTFRPEDVLDMPKLVQVLAATLVDDGWIEPELKQDLACLAACMDDFLGEVPGPGWSARCFGAKERKALGTVVEYLWDDERQNFHQSPTAGHIFNHLATLRAWLETTGHVAAGDTAGDRAPDGREVIDDFGVCPLCRQNDGYLNVARDHWFVCHKHQAKWCVGSNLFGTWRSETDEDWKRNLERIGHYREVQPICPTVPGPQLST